MTAGILYTFGGFPRHCCILFGWAWKTGKPISPRLWATVSKSRPLTWNHTPIFTVYNRPGMWRHFSDFIKTSNRYNLYSSTNSVQRYPMLSKKIHGTLIPYRFFSPNAFVCISRQFNRHAAFRWSMCLEIQGK